jgi:periplasmic protein TonB
MNQLQLSTGAFRHPRAETVRSPQQRAIGITFAISMQAAIVYMLMSGGHFLPVVVPPDITLIDVHELPKNTDPPAPPPVIDTPPVEVPIPQDVQLVYIPPAEFKAITLPPPPPVPTTLPKVATVTPPPAITFTPARAILVTHSTPDYPPVARRLGQQGTLRLKLAITEQGAVSDAVVVNSSGSMYLDAAAIEWVKQHWRYEPAKQGSRSVKSEVQAVVEFKLK